MPFSSIILVILSTASDCKDIYPSIILPSIYENAQACFSCMPAHLVTITAAEQRKHLGNLGQSRALTTDSEESWFWPSGVKTWGGGGGDQVQSQVLVKYFGLLDHNSNGNLDSLCLASSWASYRLHWSMDCSSWKLGAWNLTVSHFPEAHRIILVWYMEGECIRIHLI